MCIAAAADMIIVISLDLQDVQLFFVLLVRRENEERQALTVIRRTWRREEVGNVSSCLLLPTVLSGTWISD